MKTFYNEIYVVQEGDTLKSISEKYKLNPTTILLENAITPKSITPGLLLHISKTSE